ncbi:SagB/ThcOx family dehydrogenase [Microbispora sp. H10885]|uniref:SagB/ThcOx family dehydrogenase n=1 Tax=Microbispora sp. H10885 TaxID=2729110 RepID=UPI001603C519|nr:SagB/ThcOx family dehydrogenase [Microbispora sp. H10885]
MRVRVAEHAVLYWDDGRLVWDDYLHQQQFALTEDSSRVLWWFGKWRELRSIERYDAALVPIAERLLEAGLLIAEGSGRHERQNELKKRWGVWGPPAAYYHFATRARSGSRILTAGEDKARTREKVGASPAPPPFKPTAGRPLIALRKQRPSDAGWPHPRLMDALWTRRSTRAYLDKPVALDDLAGILTAAGGIIAFRDDPEFGHNVFKASPSAGARDPIEIYLYAGNVEGGLEPAIYHFSPSAHGVTRMGDAPSPERLVSALGGQAWLAAAPVLLIYTAMIERSQWRYEAARAYRDISLGLGHVSQTVLLTATAMGLGAVFATAVRDEELEELVGCDHMSEIVLGVTALGHPRGSTPSIPDDTAL